jgi:hypothetical protein
MGDGSFVAFRGGLAREALEIGDGSPWAAVRKAMRGA